MRTTDLDNDGYDINEVNLDKIIDKNNFFSNFYRISLDVRNGSEFIQCN